MVLIVLISLIFSLDQDPLLSTRYEKKVRKGVEKALDLSDTDLKRVGHGNSELYSIKTEGDLKGYLLLAEVAACNLGGCPAYDMIKKDKSSEYFDMMLITDKDRNILSVSILDYFSDYGYEITAKSYLKKFKGKNICDFANESDGIDAVSGATISSYALEGTLALLCDQFEYASH